MNGNLNSVQLIVFEDPNSKILISSMTWSSELSNDSKFYFAHGKEGLKEHLQVHTRHLSSELSRVGHEDPVMF